MAIASVITCSYKPLSHPTIYFPTHHRSSFQVSFPNYLSSSDSPAPQFAGNLTVRRSRRATSVVTRAGPSTNTYIFAFFFPLSLLAATIFAAMRIGDRLDQKFLEEVRLNLVRKRSLVHQGWEIQILRQCGHLSTFIDDQAVVNDYKEEEDSVTGKHYEYTKLNLDSVFHLQLQIPVSSKLAINQATRELDDDEDEESEMFIPREEEPAVPRTRNRPKREV